MSSFDAIADRVTDVSRRIFGDSATYRPKSGGEISLTLLFGLDVIEAGSIYEVGVSVTYIKIDKAVLGSVRPNDGDEIQVTSGRNAGIYDVIGIYNEDKFNYSLKVANK